MTVGKGGFAQSLQGKLKLPLRF